MTQSADTENLVEIIREASRQWEVAEAGMVIKIDLRSPLDCFAKTWKYSSCLQLKDLKISRSN